MKVTDLIMELAQMPPELEVIYNTTREGEDIFRMMVVQNVGEIVTDTEERYVLLNVDSNDFNNEEDDEDI